MKAKEVVEVGTAARECAVAEKKTDCRRLVDFHHVRILATGQLTITRLSEELWKNISKLLADSLTHSRS
jgi:hypothetical protein